MDPLYLDNNATTCILPPVWEAMRPYFAEVARERTAVLLDAHPDEVVFTSGATEANNLAIFGIAGAPPGHLLVSPVEHPCVLEPARRLAESGFRLDLLPVDGAGTVTAEAL